MNNPKPDDLKTGDVIKASWLNDAKNAGVHQSRFGAGMVGQLIGGKLVISKATDSKPRGAHVPVFAQWRVLEEFGDYLVCDMVSEVSSSSRERVNIAKPPELRGGTDILVTNPPYQTSDGSSGETPVIWAAPCGATGVVVDGVELNLMDVNFDGRSVAMGFGKPVSGASDLPVSDTIELTITNAQGLPIKDENDSEQKIRVYRNALRKSLYLDFIDDDVFFYVRFNPNYQGVEGCIFSRTEGMEVDSTYLPSGGIAISGSTAPTATNATGDAGNSGHVYVTGNFYYEKSGGTHGGWKPWFALDPDQLPGSDGKVFTDAADTTKGFLNDEIIVDPGGGADFWISKTVTPGGAADNMLLLQHKTQQAEDHTVTCFNQVTEPVANTLRYEFADMSFDGVGHHRDAGLGTITTDQKFTSDDSSIDITASVAGAVATIDFQLAAGASGGPGAKIGGLFWITIPANATDATEIELDTSDWRGRMIRFWSAYEVKTVANANTDFSWILTSGEGNAFRGASSTADTGFTDLNVSEGLLSLIIDGGDSGKLKALWDNPGSSSNEVQLVVLIEASNQISAATNTVA